MSQPMTSEMVPLERTDDGNKACIEKVRTWKWVGKEVYIFKVLPSGTGSSNVVTGHYQQLLGVIFVHGDRFLYPVLFVPRFKLPPHWGGQAAWQAI